jgi:hypothetical protein
MKAASTSLPVSRRILVAAVLSTVSVPRVVLAQSPSGAVLKKIECAFDRHRFTASLYDNPSARDLLSTLPLDLAIEDYSTNEKIARLPRKLSEQGSGPFASETPGDLCYYAPWGNLAFFHAGYRYSQGLIWLGRLDGGIEPLLTRGKFALRIAASGSGR